MAETVDRPAAPSPAKAPLPRSVRWALAVAWLLALLALLLVLLLRSRINNLQLQLARQTADAVTTAVEARTLAKRADEQAQSLGLKVSALEARVGDLTSYRDRLEHMVKAVQRARDENVVVDLEATLRFAQDQSQLTGSERPLLAALRAAEQRLNQSTEPRLIGVAQAVARDLQRLRDVHMPDTAGLLARTEQLLREVDSLPLNATLEAGATSASKKAAAAGEPPATQPSWWARWWGAAEPAQHLPAVDALRPDERLLARASLRLRLEGARLGILARQYGAARTDLAAAMDILSAWFDVQAPRTQAALQLLAQLRDLAQAPAIPDVSDTLSALQRVESQKASAPPAHCAPGVAC